VNILVTGGAGYIGSVVTHELLSQGHAVVVYDDLSTGFRNNVPAAAQFVGGNLLNTLALRRCLETHHIELVVHMAATALVGESAHNPAKYYRTNLVGGLSVLDAMHGAGVRNIVFSSTAAVYGQPLKQPIAETVAKSPTNAYGASKLALEEALGWYAEAYGYRYTVLRYFNAAGASGRYGERHDPETHVIPLVLLAAAGHRPRFTIHGGDYPTHDGTCVRDYVHVVDLARAHVLAVKRLNDPAAPNRAYNVGCGGGGYSVRDVIDTATRITGKDIAVEIGPRRPGDPPMLIADCSMIEAELGWRLAHPTLDAIIESAWTWLQSHVTRG
jgi:UDP-glucose 4-epimerase